MKRKIIVGLLLFVTMIIIGGFVIWHNPSLKKELLRLYLGSMIVNGINNDAKPAAAKLGMDIYAINQYPKITIEIKLQSYDGNDGVSKTQLKHQSCEFIDVFQTMREREKEVRMAVWIAAGRLDGIRGAETVAVMTGSSRQGWAGAPDDRVLFTPASLPRNRSSSNL